jgi:hypothetical protein
MSFFLNSYYIRLTASSIPIIYYDLIYDQYWDNTVLLLHGDVSSINMFLDYSLNNLQITKVSNPTQRLLGPLQNMGSVYFNGTPDYLRINSTTPFNFDLADFTIECWVKVDRTSGGHGLCDSATNLSSQTEGRWRLAIESGNITFARHGSGGLFIFNYTIPSFNTNSWYHIAVSRQSGTFYLFLNGQQVATSTTSVTFNDAGGLNIGAVAASTYLNGYISNLRIIKGTAIYTTNFSVPTSHVTTTSNGGATPSTLPTSSQVSLLFLNDITSQNNIFLDSSTNNFTITRNGTPTQGSFSPYSDNWSTYFNGTTDYLTIPDSEQFNLAANNFTIECWVYFNSSANQYYFAQIQQSSANRSFCHGVIGGKYYFEVRSASGSHSITSSSNITTNEWTHIAAVRNGNTITLYKNGISIGSVSVAGIIVNNSTLPVGVGGAGAYNAEPLNGYISNARIVNGTAVYTSNFTPPKSNLTAVAGTALLTCQTNEFKDKSSNNFTITVNGTPSIDSKSPFDIKNSTYYPSVNLGSGYFNGTTDSLQTIGNSWTQLGTGDFTIECWIYKTTNGGIILDTRGSNQFVPWQLAAANQIDFAYLSPSGNSTRRVTGTSTIPLNVWTHIAVSRSSGLIKVFVNGTQENSQTVTDAINGGSSAPYIGRTFDTTGTIYFGGYISNLRVVIGSAIYTSNFSVPTSPVTTTSNGGASPSTLPTPSQVSLLCNFANAEIYDNTEKNNLITVGNASVSASQVKYGTGSIVFDGSGDYLTIPASNGFNFGSENFTVECWFYSTTTNTGYGGIFVKGSSEPGRYTFNISPAGNTAQFWINKWGVGGPICGSSTVITNGVWHHLAAVRNNNVFTFYVDGVAGSVTNTWTGSIDDSLVNSYIGADPFNLSRAINAYIDDLRITKGIARYTSNFTPPSRAVPDIPYLGVFALQIDTTKTGTTTNTQFNLALRSSTSYDFDIDWGDNIVETYTSSNTTGYNHTYPAAGIYTVTIAERSLGGFPGVFYNNTGDRRKILNIAQFGGNQFGTNWSDAFNGCLNLQISATDFATTRTQNVTSFANAWSSCTSLATFPLIDTSKGQSFQSTWQNCYSLSASEFPTLNMSKMTNGTNCFAGVKLTTTSYSALLTSLCATNFNNSVTFHGGNSNYNSTVPRVTASRNFLVTPIVSGGRGWTITDGGPDINFIISASNQYWYTNFETGSATKTTGSALTSDIQVIDDNGSVLGTQFYEGTKSYYCNSMNVSNAGLTFVVNPTAFNNTNGFIIDFMAYKVAGDSFPTMLGVGLSSRNINPNSQVYNKNYYVLRWLGTNVGSIIAQTTGGDNYIVVNNTSWGSNNKWHKITYYYDNVTKYGTVYVDGVQKQTALQERGWNTLPDGNILIGLFNLGTNVESTDNGIEAYIDNLGFYTL